MRYLSSKKSTAKLTLGKETLRRLESHELGQVGSGNTPPSIHSNSGQTSNGGENGPTAGCTAACWRKAS